MFLTRFRRFTPCFEGDGGGGTGGAAGGTPPQTTPKGAETPAFDYEKLASIISGKQNVAEDTVLKNFFKQQGLSKEEMELAISAFKEQKAQNTPDVAAMQQQAAQAQAAALQAQIEKEALLMGAELGIEMKTVPYLIKMADLSEVAEGGKIDNEKLKTALEAVLKDVPQLKTQTSSEGGNGFKFGASGGSGDNKATDEQLKAAFGL